MDPIWNERLGFDYDEWLGVAALPDGDRFAASSRELHIGERIHFYEGLARRSPLRSDSQEWDVEPVGAWIRPMPDGDTLLIMHAPNAMWEFYWSVFRGAAASEVYQVTKFGLGMSYDFPAVPAFLPYPLPEAGEDQRAVAGDDCCVEVQLHGSASFDAACAPPADERVLEFTWWENGAFLAQGVEPSVRLGLGIHTLTFRVEDTSRRVWEDTMQVEVVDETPPTFTVMEASPSFLWPPDHAMRDVGILLEVHDNCDAAPAIQLVQASSSEPENNLGDGDTAPDIEGADLGTDDRSLFLRAERSGIGAGRTYTILYTATDLWGNMMEGEAQVRVAHDMGGPDEP